MEDTIAELQQQVQLLQDLQRRNHLLEVSTSCLPIPLKSGLTLVGLDL